VGVFQKSNFTGISVGLVKNSCNLFHVLFILLFLLMTVYLSPEELDTVVLVEPEVIPLGNRFSITILVNVENPNLFNVEKPDFPSSIRLYSGPLIRPFYEERESRQISEGMRIQYIFTAVASGRFVTEGFTIVSGDKKVKTEPVVLRIGEYINGKLLVPPRIRWELYSDRVYSGQTASVILKAVMQEEIKIFERIKVDPPGMGIFENVKGLGEIETETYMNSEFFSYPVASYLYTPTRTGRVLLPPAYVYQDGLSGRAGGVWIWVDPVPEEIKESGAIGDFTLSTMVEKQIITGTEESKLHIRIEGVGNLDYLKPPEPLLEEMQISAKEEKVDIIPHKAGYEGVREIIYSLSSKEEHSEEKKGRVSIPSFKWFNPETGEIEKSQTEEYTITIRPSPVYEEKEEFPFTLMEIEEINSMREKNLYTQLCSYFFLLPGTLILGVCLILQKGGKALLPVLFILLGATLSGVSSIEELVLRGIEYYNEGELFKAQKCFSDALESRPGNPGLLFNRGIINYRLGRYGEAIADLRKAILYEPSNMELREYLDWMEEKLSLEAQAKLPSFIHPDIFFIITVVSWNLLCLTFTVFLYRKTAMIFILTVLLSVMFAISGGGLIYTALERGQEKGVVREKKKIKKIPEETSSAWFALQEGTTVRIISSSYDFYLAETAYGVKGWIKKPVIILY